MNIHFVLFENGGAEGKMELGGDRIRAQEIGGA